MLDVPLTSRELQVLSGISRGLTNTEIGAELFLSMDTIKSHCRTLRKKLNARDRSHAVTRGFEVGLLTASGGEEVWSLHTKLAEYARENGHLRQVVATCVCSGRRLKAVQS